MVESTAVSCIQSSHPDKYNNSVDRIISKEEEREDPRRELQSSFQLKSKSVSSHSVQLQSKYSVSTRNPAIPCYSTYRINSTTRNTTTTRLIPCKASSSDCSCVSKHSTRQNKAPGSPTSTRPYSTPSAPDPYRQASSNSTWQKQHSKRQPASTQPLQQFPGKLHSTWYYRILPGETGFISKGSSIVYLCNTKVSVFQITY